MKCPKCMHVIDDKLVAKYRAAKGGAKGKRAINKEAQAKMQAGRQTKKEIKKC